jgi:hypothetical protein
MHDVSLRSIDADDTVSEGGTCSGAEARSTQPSRASEKKKKKKRYGTRRGVRAEDDDESYL